MAPPLMHPVLVECILILFLVLPAYILPAILRFGIMNLAINLSAAGIALSLNPGAVYELPASAPVPP